MLKRRRWRKVRIIIRKVSLYKQVSDIYDSIEITTVITSGVHNEYQSCCVFSFTLCVCMRVRCLIELIGTLFTDFTPNYTEFCVFLLCTDSMQMVLPNIYMGSAVAAQNHELLESYGVSLVINHHDVRLLRNSRNLIFLLFRPNEQVTYWRSDGI